MPEIAWTPTGEQVARSAIGRFMAEHGMGSHAELLARSVDEPDWFWDAVVRFLGLEWFTPYETVLDASDGIAWARWFTGGTLNLAHNCLDRHAASDPGRPALVWEGEDGATRALTYGELRDMTDRLAAGIRMLDAGCGRGRILTRLATLYPRSRFVGMDLSSEAIDWARADATRAGLTNLAFDMADLSDFNTTAPPGAFDFVTTFDAIHDQGKPLNVLEGIHRTLRSDGVYLMQDINGTGHLERDLDHPVATFLYSVSCMHCMTVSLAQGGEGLGTMWGEEKTREYLHQAGFRAVTTHRLAHDIMNNWYVVTK